MDISMISQLNKHVVVVFLCHSSDYIIITQQRKALMGSKIDLLLF